MACSSEPASAKTELCRLCQTDLEVVFFCKNCKLDLCQKCRIEHLQNETSKEHRVLYLVKEPQTNEGDDNENDDDEDDDRKESERLENSNLCSIHPDNYLKMYCENCETFVCNTCICELHRGHGFERLIVVVNRSKDQLTDIIKATKQRIADLQKKLDYLEEYQEDYSALADMAIEDTKRENRQLKEKIDKVADDLIEEERAKLRRFLAYCHIYGAGSK